MDLIRFFKKIFFYNKKLQSLSVEEIEILSTPRSSKWKKFRENHLKNNPVCAVCGSSKNLVPHHIIPFHIDESKELDPNNIITLCENENFNCHFFFGHFKNWCKYNSNIIEDAELWRKRIKNED